MASDGVVSLTLVALPPYFCQNCFLFLGLFFFFSFPKECCNALFYSIQNLGSGSWRSCVWQSWFVLFHTLSQQHRELGHQACETKPEKLLTYLGHTASERRILKRK